MIGNIGYNDTPFSENWTNSTIVTKNHNLDEYEFRENNIIDGNMGIPLEKFSNSRGGYWNPTSISHAKYQKDNHLR